MSKTGGQIMIHVRCPSYLRLSATEKRVASVEEALKQLIPEIGLTPDWLLASYFCFTSPLLLVSGGCVSMYSIRFEKDVLGTLREPVKGESKAKTR